jgi:hypothetical protein
MFFECTYLAINEEFFLLCCFVASGREFEIQLARLSQVRLTEAYFESLRMGYLQPLLKLQIAMYRTMLYKNFTIISHKTTEIPLP